ncbi:polyphosphate polymerase domain-containing protein [candidate division KSB1 bacterium]|nr:polyphosphate polymerase domain-containing protein [candidate division KSB1 bacterium]
MAKAVIDNKNILNNSNLIISDYRFERKFYITELSKYNVESIVKMNPAFFSEIYYQRWVNNIYFDTLNFNNYYDNTEGVTNRIKIRVRWYGDLFGFIEKPTLELKIKNGLVNKKISIPVKPFHLNQDTSLTDILNCINEVKESLTIDFRSLYPSLLNRYSRKYYQSGDGHYRITIDSDLHFYEINKQNNSFLNKSVDKNSVILELKYDQQYDARAARIASKFPFRNTKSSKYVNGVHKVRLMAF